MLNREGTKVMTLAKSAMLVSVTIINGGLLGERRDRQASELVENTYNISHRRAKASKFLIDRKHKAVRQVVSASQRVREVVYRYSMPWGDEKLRLLPVKTSEEFRSKLKVAFDELNEAREEYIQAYPALVSASERDLGELFDASQYPTSDKVRDLFTAKVSYWPIPDSGHFMADVSKEAAKEAKESIEAEIEERLIEATYDMVKRAKEVVSAFLDKLETTPLMISDISPNIQQAHIQGTIRDSLVDNIKDTANLIERMNLTGNVQIKKVVKDLERLCEYSAAVWREKPWRYHDERPQAITTAQEIMVKLQMLDLRDQEIGDMVADASDYL